MLSMFDEDEEPFLPGDSVPVHKARKFVDKKLWFGLLLVLFVIVASFLVSGSPSKTPKKTSNNDPFHWQRCDIRSDPRYVCGYLEVPLDYTNTSDPRKARIAVTMFKVLADKKSEKTLLINPGGPGGSGTKYAWSKGEWYSTEMTGGISDVLGWDPRGVNLTEPHISCFPEDVYRDRWEPLTMRIGTGGFENLLVADAMNEAIMRGCRERYGDIPRFISTAFVARDVDAIREALGEPELNAMFSSYGTAIGQTYTQLFPERVGRIALDGMEYTPEARVPWGWALMAMDNATDIYMEGFLGECVAAGPSRCALASPSDTIESLATRMDALFDRLFHRPAIGYTPEEGPGMISYDDLVGLLSRALTGPSLWPQTARLLADLEKGNATAALRATALGPYIDEENVVTHSEGRAYNLPKTNSMETHYLVICADASDAEKKPIDWWENVRQNLTKESPMTGNDRLYSTLPCRHYDWKSAEVYRGDFTKTLKNPILLVGGVLDPSTPLRSAKLLANEMQENARLVIHHGYGHLSGRDPSTCTHNILRSYLKDGILPENRETDCYPDRKPYPPT